MKNWIIDLNIDFYQIYFDERDYHVSNQDSCEIYWDIHQYLKEEIRANFDSLFAILSPGPEASLLEEAADYYTANYIRRILGQFGFDAETFEEAEEFGEI